MIKLTLFLLLITCRILPQVTNTDLIKNIETACSLKDSVKFFQQFNLAAADEELMNLNSFIISDIMKDEVDSISISPLNKDIKLERILNGYKYSVNVEVEGMLNISFKNRTDIISFPFGKSEGRYYLAGMKKEKVDNPFRQIVYNVIIIANITDVTESIVGNIEYLLNGKTENEEVKSKGSITKVIWADKITEVKIRNGSSDCINLEIQKGDNVIYESGQANPGESIKFSGEK